MNGTTLNLCNGEFDFDSMNTLRFQLAMPSVDDVLCNNKKMVLALVSRDGLYLRFVSRELRADEDVALAAIANDGHAFAFIDRYLQYDVEFVEKAANINAVILNYVAIDYLEIITLDLIKNCTSSREIYKYLPNIVQEKLLHTLEAVKRGALLADVSKQLRQNKEVVLAALKSNFDANFKFVEIPITSAFALEIISTIDDPTKLYEALPPKYYDDKEFVLALVKEDGPTIIGYAPKYAKDVDVLSAAMGTA